MNPFNSDANLGTLDGDFFKVPLTDRALESAGGGDHAIGGTVGLARIDLRVGRGLVVVVEDLSSHMPS